MDISVQQTSPQVPETKDPVLAGQQKETTAPASDQGTSKWYVIFLLIFFPPIAWIYMWKEKRFHSWFALLLALNAIFGLVLQVILGFFIIPQLLIMYKNLSITTPAMGWVMPSFYVGVFISIAQILFAIYLWKQVKKSGGLSKKLLAIVIILLALNFLLPAAGSILSYIPVLQSIYDLLNY